MPLELLVPIGVLVGAFSAIFGVGGGVIIVPVLVMMFGFDQHLAQGTSLAAIVPTAVAGAIAHRQRGFLDLRLAGWLGLGGVLGVLGGAAIALGTPADVLRDVFGIFLVVAGLRIVLQSRGAPGSAEGDAGDA